MTQIAVGFKDATTGREKKTDGLWTHLGNMLLRTLTVTDKATLPPGTAQGYLGSWNAGSTYSTTSGPWVESPIQVNVNSTGGVLTRIEWSVTLANSVAGTLNYIGIGWDGGAQWNAAQVHAPGAGYHFVVSGTGYVVLAPGAHRVAIWCGTTAGILQFQGTNNMLNVTEQRA